MPGVSFKVSMLSKFLFSHLILYNYHPMNFCKKINLDKMNLFRSFKKTFKFAAILVHHSHQSSLNLE